MTTNTLQTLLDLDAKRTQGTVHHNGNQIVIVRDIDGVRERIDMEYADAAYTAQAMNLAPQLARCLLMAEEALLNVEEVAGLKYKALSAIEKLKAGM